MITVKEPTSIEIIGMGNVSAVLSGKDFIGLYHGQDLLTLIKNSKKTEFYLLIAHGALNETKGYIKYEKEIRV